MATLATRRGPIDGLGFDGGRETNPVGAGGGHLAFSGYSLFAGLPGNDVVLRSHPDADL